MGAFHHIFESHRVHDIRNGTGDFQPYLPESAFFFLPAAVIILNTACDRLDGTFDNPDNFPEGQFFGGFLQIKSAADAAFTGNVTGALENRYFSGIF